MNKVTIMGKIARVTFTEKVIYATICASRSRKFEYIPVTIFDVDFFKKYFYEGKWIGIEGHIQIQDKDRDYKMEIIADDLYFCGEPNEIDKKLNELFLNPN